MNGDLITSPFVHSICGKAGNLWRTIGNLSRRPRADGDHNPAALVHRNPNRR